MPEVGKRHAGGASVADVFDTPSQAPARTQMAGDHYRCAVLANSGAWRVRTRDLLKVGVILMRLSHPLHLVCVTALAGLVFSAGPVGAQGAAGGQQPPAAGGQQNVLDRPVNI